MHCQKPNQNRLGIGSGELGRLGNEGACLRLILTERWSRFAAPPSGYRRMSMSEIKGHIFGADFPVDNKTMYEWIGMPPICYSGWPERTTT